MSKESHAKINSESIRPRTIHSLQRENHQDSLLVEILAELRELRKQVAEKPQIQSVMDYKEAAKLLNMGESTLQNHVLKGPLKLGRHYFKIKGHVSFPRDLVDRIMEDQLDESKREDPCSRRPAKTHKARKATARKLTCQSAINESY